MMRRSKALCILIVATILPIASTAQQVFTDAPVHVTAIEIVADVRDSRGEVPDDLTLTDFAVLEDGVERPVIGVDYLRAPDPAADESAQVERGVDDPAPPPRVDAPRWQIVIYFDHYLSGSSTIRGAAESLQERADELARLGSVSIVAADPNVTTLLSDSRDAAAIRHALGMAASRPAKNWLISHRRRFQYRSDMERGRPVNTSLGALAADEPGGQAARPHIVEEIAAVNRFRSALIETLALYPRRTPRALFVVSDGFEVDPTQFYLQFPTHDAARVYADSVRYQLGPQTDSLSRLLAVAGWTTLGVHGTLGSGEQWIDDASRSSVGRVRSPRPREATYATMRADEPLDAFAAATGGSAGTRADVGAIVSGLADRVLITYQVSRPPDGRARRIEVRARRPGLTIRTPLWSSETTPEEIASARTSAMLHESGRPGGDLPTSAAVEWDNDTTGRRRTGEITIQSSLELLAPLLRDRKAVFRVTIAAAAKKGQAPFVMHRIVSNYDVASGVFLYRAPMEIPKGRLEIVATVEELSTGLWGGDRVGINR